MDQQYYDFRYTMLNKLCCFHPHQFTYSIHSIRNIENLTSEMRKKKRKKFFIYYSVRLTPLFTYKKLIEITENPPIQSIRLQWKIKPSQKQKKTMAQSRPKYTFFSIFRYLVRNVHLFLGEFRFFLSLSSSLLSSLSVWVRRSCYVQLQSNQYILFNFKFQ